MDPSDDPKDAELYRELKARVREAGVFEGRPWFYPIKELLLVIGFVGSYLGLLAFPPGAPWALCIVVSAMSMLHFGMLGHECGHYAISRRRWVNDLWGYVGMSFVCGLSFSYWRGAHNLHHRSVQVEGVDPDISYTTVSMFEAAALASRAPARWLLPLQPYYFWPATLFFWVPMRFEGLVNLFRKPRETRLDRWVLLGHYLMWLLVPTLVVGVKLALLNYVVASNILGSTTASLFAVNHIGLPTVKPGETRTTAMRYQIATTRNVDNHAFFDNFFSGLNFHIEHHLFPQVGHDRLRRCHEVTQRFCAEHGIAYSHQPFGAAAGDVTRRLREIARVARPRGADEGAARQG